MRRNDLEVAPPPGTRPDMGPRLWRLVFATFAAVVLAFAVFFVPVPIFYAFLPGPVRNVENLVEVERARTYSSEGKLYLTTVSVDTQVTVPEMIASLLEREKSVVLRHAVTGGASLEQLERLQRLEMRMSQRQAQQVALQALGLGRARARGVRVVETLRDRPAGRLLRAGDVIVSLDGRTVSSTCDVIRGVNRHDIGDEVDMTIRRAGRARHVRLRTVESPNEPGAPFIGVAMQDVGFQFDSGVTVSFKTGQVAGPSAGLMLALALYDRLTPEDLTRGRDVAGTGTIRCDGRVGAIGGIEQKVAGAEAAGAEVFLAPKGNFEAASNAARRLEVVAISSFRDALDFFERRSPSAG